MLTAKGVRSLHGNIQKGVRFGAALALALVLCATAALAAETGGKRLVPVGHTVGVKLFSRGVVVVKLPEGSTPARTCGLKTGDVIEACGGRTVRGGVLHRCVGTGQHGGDRHGHLLRPG